MGDGIDGAGKGHTNAEMLADPMAAHGMRAAAGGFADDHGALQHFQIVSELFSAGKSVLGGSTKAGLPSKRLPRTEGSFQ